MDLSELEQFTKTHSDPILTSNWSALAPMPFAATIVETPQNRPDSEILKLLGRHLVKEGQKKTLSRLVLLNKESYLTLMPVLYQKVELNDRMKGMSFLNDIERIIRQLEERCGSEDSQNLLELVRKTLTCRELFSERFHGLSRVFAFSYVEVLDFKVIPAHWDDGLKFKWKEPPKELIKPSTLLFSSRTHEEKFPTLQHDVNLRLVKFGLSNTTRHPLLFPSLKKLIFQQTSMPLSRVLCRTLQAYSNPKALDLVFSSSVNLAFDDPGSQQLALHNLDMILFQSLYSVRIYGVSSYEPFLNDRLGNVQGVTICLQNIGFDDDMKDIWNENLSVLESRFEVRERIKLVRDILEATKMIVEERKKRGMEFKVWIYGVGGGKDITEVKRYIFGKIYQGVLDQYLTETGSAYKGEVPGIWRDVVLMEKSCVCGYCIGEYRGQTKRILYK